MKKYIITIFILLMATTSFSQANLSDAYHVRARTKLQLGTITITGFSIDGTMAGNSDVLLPTQKAVKTYVNALASSSASSYAPLARTITINGVSYDLSANRSWSVGTVTGTGTTSTLSYWSASGTLASTGLTYFSSTGNLANNTTTDNGYKFYNNGSFYNNGALAIGGAINQSGANNYLGITNGANNNTGFGVASGGTLKGKVHINPNSSSVSDAALYVEANGSYSGYLIKAERISSGGSVMYLSEPSGTSVDVNAGGCKIVAGSNPGDEFYAGIYGTGGSFRYAIRGVSGATGYTPSLPYVAIGTGNTAVVVGNETYDQSAQLTINSTSAGFLPPRMTTTQRDAINSGTFATGLIIFNTTTSQLNIYDGSRWSNLSKSITSSTTWDCPSTGTLSSSYTDITVTGAAVGDVVNVGISNRLNGSCLYYATVVSSNTVRLFFENLSTGGSQDPPSATYNIIIQKF